MQTCMQLDHIRLRVSLDKPTNPHKNCDLEELLPPPEADILNITIVNLPYYYDLILIS